MYYITYQQAGWLMGYPHSIEDLERISLAKVPSPHHSLSLSLFFKYSNILHLKPILDTPTSI